VLKLPRSPIRHSLRWSGLLGAALLTYAPLSYADDRVPPIEAFRHLQDSLASDKRRADWHAFLIDARLQKAFLNGSPTSRLEGARAELQLGHRQEALAEVRRFLAMGQTNDILETPLFLPLKTDIARELGSNKSSVSVAKPAFKLSDPELIPEDIDYDPISKRFLITSVLQHNIILWITAVSRQSLPRLPITGRCWPLKWSRSDAWYGPLK